MQRSEKDRSIETEDGPFLLLRTRSDGKSFIPLVRAKEAKFVGLTLVPFIFHQKEGEQDANPCRFVDSILR